MDGTQYFFLALAVLLMACVWLRKWREGVRREKLFRDSKRVATWGEVLQNKASVRKIVRVNFGYGMEIWALEGSQEVALRPRGFQRGKLVLPRPSAVEVERFARENDVGIVLMQVKY